MRTAGGSLVLALLALVVLAPSASAQEGGGDGSRLWLAAGLGAGHGHLAPDAMALSLHAAWLQAPHRVSLRALGLVKPLGGTGESASEFGVLYGRAHTGWLGHASVLAGAAVTSFERCGEGMGGCATVGLPVVAEAALRVFPVAGLGAQFFGNLNPRSVYGGLLVFVQLGWLGS